MNSHSKCVLVVFFQMSFYILILIYLLETTQNLRLMTLLAIYFDLLKSTDLHTSMYYVFIYVYTLSCMKGRTVPVYPVTVVQQSLY